MADDKFIKDIYAKLSAQRIAITYLGEITPNMVNALLTNLKQNNSTFDDEVVAKKKVYKIIVECLENICRHSDPDENNKVRPSIFLLGKQDTHYEIITGNHVYAKQAGVIKEKLDYINSLDRENIKKQHLEILSKSTASESEGAGLGMMDIALKSGNKLEYQFIPVEDSSLLFYILKVGVVLES